MSQRSRPPGTYPPASPRQTGEERPDLPPTLEVGPGHLTARDKSPICFPLGGGGGQRPRRIGHNGLRWRATQKARRIDIPYGAARGAAVCNNASTPSPPPSFPSSVLSDPPTQRVEPVSAMLQRFRLASPPRHLQSIQNGSSTNLLGLNTQLSIINLLTVVVTVKNMENQTLS